MDLVKRSDGNIVTRRRFGDGQEYVVSLSVDEVPRSLTIRISDKITSEEWGCTYELKYIEELTQRTGNYKSFDVFIAMLKCALLKSTDSVELELMTYDDLIALKSMSNNRLNKNVRRGFVSKESTSNSTDFNTAQSQTLSQAQIERNNNVPSKLNKKRYLIVTYIAEFDNVHYPLPLSHMKDPDPFIMESNIKKLQAEVTHLRNVNQDLMDQVKNHNEERKERIQIESVMDAMNSLEIKIGRERLEHRKEMEKLRDENNHLRDKISELQLVEEELNSQITRLEQLMSRNEAKTSSAAPTQQQQLPFSSVRSRHNSGSRTRFQNVRPNNAGSRSRNGSMESQNKKSPSPYASIPTANRIGRGQFQRNRSNTLSPAPGSTGFTQHRPYQKFDPTGYVRGKKSRQEEIAQLRLLQIQKTMPRARKFSTSAERDPGNKFKTSPGQGPPIHAEMRLVARRERSLSRDLEKQSIRGRSKEKRRMDTMKGKISNLKSRVAGKPVKKLLTLKNEDEATGKRNPFVNSSNDFEGSLEALEAYIEDANQKIAAYGSVGKAFGSAS